MTVTHKLKQLSCIKELGYKFVYAPYFVDAAFYKFFNFIKYEPTPINPLTNKQSAIILFDKYVYLLDYARSKQHLPLPLKLYTVIDEGGICEISGICISKNQLPLRHIVDVVSMFTSRFNDYEIVTRDQFKLCRLYRLTNTTTLEVGLFDNLTGYTSKQIGFRGLPDAVYFKLNSTNNN